MDCSSDAKWLQKAFLFFPHGDSEEVPYCYVISNRTEDSKVDFTQRVTAISCMLSKPSQNLVAFSRPNSGNSHTVRMLLRFISMK